METGLRKKIPDKLVVLTFDDGCKSQVDFRRAAAEVVWLRCDLLYYGGSEFPDEQRSLHDVEEVRGLHDAGFEVGNHTRHHRNVARAASDGAASGSGTY